MQPIKALSSISLPAFLPAPPALPPTLGAKLMVLSKAMAPGNAFEFQTSDGHVTRIGSGAVRFRLEVHSDIGVKALMSFDELRIAEAYMDGHLNIEGDLLAALALRGSLTDRHPWLRFWLRTLQPLLRGQTSCDRDWVGQHYDEDPAFYELFLDKQYRCYTQGHFAAANDTLEDAVARKFNAAVEACGIEPGSRVLDIGAGWGSFTEFAGSRGIQVTSLTIAKVSHDFVNDLIARRRLPCRVQLVHLLEYTAGQPFDAIVNFGVSEHLPDYAATIRQYQRLLKPGGRIYLDTSASRTRPSTVTNKHIYPGNATFLSIPDYLRVVGHSALSVIRLENETETYGKTMECWARNLEQARETIVERFGGRQYRRFRLYFWSAVRAFQTRDLEAYHMVLEHAGRR
jgi:cyclopropane-fatty-acyl-phospholipid synthase